MKNRPEEIPGFAGLKLNGRKGVVTKDNQDTETANEPVVQTAGECQSNHANANRKQNLQEHEGRVAVYPNEVIQHDFDKKNCKTPF